MGVLEFLFTFLIFSIPFGQIVRLDRGDIGIILPDILVILIFIYYLFKLIFKRNLKTPAIMVPLVLFLLTMLLSLSLNLFNLSTGELRIAFLYQLRFFLYASILFAFPYLDKNFINNKVINFMLLSGIIVTIIGIFQWIFYPDLRNLFYLGWDEHLYRLFSSFLDPNSLGAFLVLVLLLSFHLFFKREGIEKKGLLFFLLIVSISIFLTFSRSAYLMLVVGSGVYLWRMNKKREMIVGAIIFVVAFGILVNNSFFGEGTKLFRTASINARVLSSENALEIIKENPIFGVGFNAYKYSKDDLENPNSTQFKMRSSSGTDNSFLFIMATMGTIGFMAFVYLVYSIVKFSNRSREVGALVISSLVALGVGTLFNNLVFYPFIIIWIFLLISYSMESN